MPDLQLYNSLTRKKEAFEPLDSSHIRLYACGPTVYNYAHIGNARMAVVFDVLSRVLKQIYPKVTYVSNITDIDDKIITAAQEQNVEIDLITNKYAQIYNEDMLALGVQKPDKQPRATEHIADMIALIEKLIARNHAYAAENHVLFHVPSYPAYGALSGRSRDEQIAGARVEIAPYKKDPADFILWKPSSESEPGWDSPWGFGRPGWHIECSAMAENHLGLPFDIHGGGADLKFPHHENEIAQSCCAQDKQTDPDAFAKTWIHNGFVTVEGEKMSKSLGNVTLVHDLIAENPDQGAMIRLALLSAHYRQPLDWNTQILKQASILYEKIGKAAAHLENVQAAKNPDANPVFEALLDDLNTPQAFAALNALLKQIMKAPQEALPALKGRLEQALQVLGIAPPQPAAQNEPIPEEILALLEERQKARAEKNYAQADAVRDILAKKGYVIEDTKKGAVLKPL